MFHQAHKYHHNLTTAVGDSKICCGFLKTILGGFSNMPYHFIVVDVVDGSQVNVDVHVG